MKRRKICKFFKKKKYKIFIKPKKLSTNRIDQILKINQKKSLIDNLGVKGFLKLSQIILKEKNYKLIKLFFYSFKIQLSTLLNLNPAFLKIFILGKFSL